MISPFKCSPRDAHAPRLIRDNNTLPFSPRQAGPSLILSLLRQRQLAARRLLRRFLLPETG